MYREFIGVGSDLQVMLSVDVVSTFDVVILLSGPNAMICDDKFALVFEVKLENT